MDSFSNSTRSYEEKQALDTRTHVQGLLSVRMQTVLRYHWVSRVHILSSFPPSASPDNLTWVPAPPLPVQIQSSCVPRQQQLNYPGAVEQSKIMKRDPCTSRVSKSQGLTPPAPQPLPLHHSQEAAHILLHGSHPQSLYIAG